MIDEEPATATGSSCDVRTGPVDPGPPRRWPTWCRVVLAAVMMLAAALSVVLPALIPGAREWGATLSGWPLVGFATLQFSLPTLTALLFVWLAMRFVDRRPVRQAGWRFDAKSIPALLLATAVAAGLTILAGLIGNAAGTVRPDEAFGGLPAAMDLVLRGLVMAFLMQGIPEELIWRGYVMQTLRTPAITSVYVSAVGFGLLHLLSSGGQENPAERVLYLGAPFAFAVLAGALLLRTGSLWAAFGVHGGTHLGTAIGALFFGTGGGPVVWIAETVLYLAVAIPLLHRRRRTATSPAVGATGGLGATGSVGASATGR